MWFGVAELLELLGEFTVFGREFCAAAGDVVEQLLVGRLGELEGADEPGSALADLGDGLLGGGDALLMLELPRVVDVAEGCVEQLPTVAAEDVVGEEVVEPVEQDAFLDPQAGGMPVGDGLALLRSACVEGAEASGISEHPSPAEGAEHV